jgi:hypothetical protein
MHAWDRCLAYLCIDKADRDKYCLFVNGFKTQHSLGNIQYPKTLDEAQAILSVQTSDKAYKEKMAKKKSQTWLRDKMRCYRKIQMFLSIGFDELPSLDFFCKYRDISFKDFVTAVPSKVLGCTVGQL